MNKFLLLSLTILSFNIVNSQSEEFCYLYKFEDELTYEMKTQNQNFLNQLRIHSENKNGTYYEHRPVKVVIAHMFDEEANNLHKYIVEQAGRLGSQYSYLENIFDVIDILKLEPEYITLLDSLDRIGNNTHYKIYSENLFRDFYSEIFKNYNNDIILISLKRNYSGPAGTTTSYTTPEGWAHPIGMKFYVEDLIHNDNLIKLIDSNENIEDWPNGDLQSRILAQISIFGHEWSHAFNGSGHEIQVDYNVQEPNRHALSDTIYSNELEDSIVWQTITANSRANVGSMIISSLKSGLGYAISQNNLDFNIFYKYNNQTYLFDSISPINVKFGSEFEDNINHPNGLTAEDYFETFLSLRDGTATTITSVIDEDSFKVYPNPTYNNIYIDIGVNEVARISLLDFFGRELYAKAINKNQENYTFLNIPNNVLQGWYAINFYNDREGLIHSKPILILK